MKKRKSLGQNFLVDEFVGRQIVDAAGLSKDQEILEIGPGKVLSGLFKRFSKDFNVYNIETIEDLKIFEI